MKTKAVIDNPQMQQYIELISSRETSEAKVLREKIASLGQVGMSIDPDSGQLLAFLASLINANKVLEIGTYYGYSTLWLASALPDDGRLITCDIDATALAVAKEAWVSAGMDHKIEAIIQKAEVTLEQLVEKQLATFDFIFIDADKRSYDVYYEQGLKLLRPGGLIAIDNVLSFSTQFVYNNEAASGRAVDTLNKKLKTDPRIELVTLSVGDGITLVKKL